MVLDGVEVMVKVGVAPTKLMVVAVELNCVKPVLAALVAVTTQVPAEVALK